MNRWLSCAIVAAVFSGCAPTAESVLEDAAEAIGGTEAVLAANTLVLDGTGQTYRLLPRTPICPSTSCTPTDARWTSRTTAGGWTRFAPATS